MLHHQLAFEVDFVIDGEVGVTAEEFVTPFKLLQKSEQGGET